MQPLIEFGVSFIIALQATGDWFILPMRLFSYLGTVEFFLLFLPLIYWSVDSALGLRVGLILMTSDIVNYTLKVLLAGPRPYWVSSHVRGLWAETSFGIPSGHAQHAVTVWGIIAVYLKKTWGWGLAISLMFLIGVSRLFLGAHFPHDVVAGWGLGTLVLWGFTKFWNPAQNWLLRKTLREQVFIAFLTSLILLAVGYAAASIRSEYQVPQAWMDHAMRVEGAEPPSPVDANNPFTSAGVLFGLAAGAAWTHAQGGFVADGPLQKRAFRYVIGLVGVAVFYVGLGEVFPHGDALPFYALRYFRYALVGFWVSGGAPWVFKKTHLI